MNAEPWVVNSHGLPVFRMANGIYKWIVAGDTLCHERRDNGGEWPDSFEFPQGSLKGDGSIGSPAGEPEGNVEQGSLCNTDLCTLFIGFSCS